MFRTFGALVLLASVLSLASCSDDNSDTIGGACRVIVETCHVGSSMGECVDAIGSLPADCIDCISRSGCDYASCQVTSQGCRIPVPLMGKTK